MNIAMDRSSPSIENSVVGLPLIEAQGVRKKYCRNLRHSLKYGMYDVIDAMLLRPGSPETLRPAEFWALDDVSFKLHRGDSLGVLGVNGSGKSTLIKLVTGQRSLTTGKIVTRGRIVALTELGLGFNGALTGRENIYVNASVFGMSRQAVDNIIEEIIQFAEIPDFIDSAVQTYSSGMKARLGFAVATHLEPDILIVDEVLAVGDLAFRRKCISHVAEYLERGGSMLLVAHDPFLIQSICTRSIILEKGRLIFEGSAIEGVKNHFALGHTRGHQAQSAVNQTVEDAISGRAMDEMSEVSGAAQKLRPVLAETNGFSSDLVAGTSFSVDADHHSRPRRSLSDKQPVIVDRFEFNSDQSGSLTTGSSVCVVMHYRSRVNMPVSWGFNILTNDLRVSIASLSTGLDGAPKNLKKGSHTFVCRIPNLPLRPGRYAIRGGVGDAVNFSPLSLLGYEEPPEFFVVVPDKDSRAENHSMLMNDIIEMNAEWND